MSQMMHKIETTGDLLEGLLQRHRDQLVLATSSTRLKDQYKHRATAAGLDLAITDLDVYIRSSESDRHVECRTVEAIRTEVESGPWTCKCGYENPATLPECGGCERLKEAS